jgi:hypothetical protein
MNVFIRIGIAALAALGLAFAASPVAAQRGVGGDEGVARMRVRPEVVTLEGEIVAINIGPCERTTGRARVGVHLLVERTSAVEKDASEAAPAPTEAALEPWNIHISPQSAVYEMLAKFPLGTQVTVVAFRTDKMPANHYVAKKVASDEATVTLRDETLRPAWAGSGVPGLDNRPMRATGPRYGRGAGDGRGREYGQSRGRGRDFERGAGPGPHPYGRMGW